MYQIFNILGMLFLSFMLLFGNDVNLTKIHPYIFSEKYKGFDIPDKMLKNDKDLVDLIIKSKALETHKDKQNWFNLYPLMTKEQVDKLRQILLNEKKRLLEIEKKYKRKKREIREKYIRKWIITNKIFKKLNNHYNNLFCFYHLAAKNEIIPDIVLSKCYKKIGFSIKDILDKYYKNFDDLKKYKLNMLLYFAEDIVGENNQTSKIKKYQKIYKKIQIERFLKKISPYALYENDFYLIKRLIEMGYIKEDEKIFLDYLILKENPDYIKAFKLSKKYKKNFNWIGDVGKLLLISNKLNKDFYKNYSDELENMIKNIKHIQTDILILKFLNEYYIKEHNLTYYKKIQNDYLLEKNIQQLNFENCEELHCGSERDWYKNLTIKLLFDNKNITDNKLKNLEAINYTPDQKIEWYTYKALLELVKLKNFSKKWDIDNFNKLIKVINNDLDKIKNNFDKYNSNAKGYVEKYFYEFIKSEVNNINKNFLYKLKNQKHQINLISLIRNDIGLFITFLSIIGLLITITLYFNDPIKYYQFHNIVMKTLFTNLLFKKYFHKKILHYIENNFKLKNYNLKLLEKNYYQFKYKFNNNEEYFYKKIYSLLNEKKNVLISGEGGLSKTFSSLYVASIFFKKQKRIPIFISESDILQNNCLFNLPINMKKEEVLKLLKDYGYNKFLFIVDDFFKTKNELDEIISKIKNKYSDSLIIITSRNKYNLKNVEIIQIIKDNIKFSEYIESNNLSILKKYLLENKIFNFLFLYLLNELIKERKDISKILENNKDVLAIQTKILQDYIDLQIDRFIIKYNLSVSNKYDLLEFFKKFATKKNYSQIKKNLQLILNCATDKCLFETLSYSTIVTIYSDKLYFSHDFFKEYFLSVENIKGK